MKCSDLFVKALENEGVNHIFGVPGEENLDFVESLRHSTQIQLITTRHEQSAGFMAATIGRLTGKAGVCLSTLGPGATNFATSAAYAHLGGFPCLMITGQKPILKSKQGAFQIVDIVGLMQPITKLAKQVVDGGLIPPTVREAFRRAEEEKPGPVHVELPEDVAGEEVAEEQSHIFPRDRVRRPIAENKAIKQAIDMIVSATHPLLVVGAGANRKVTSNMLRQLVEQTGLFFCDTQMGKGVIDSRDPRYLGTAALSDADYIHHAIKSADLILMVGHDVVEKPPFFMHHEDNRKVIHVNFVSAQVDQVYFPQLEVIGDIGNAIWQIKEGLKGQSLDHWDLRYFEYVKSMMDENLNLDVACSGIPMAPPCFVSIIRSAVPDDGIVCLDNGLYKVWFARQYGAYHPNTLLLDNALATMGAGLPSAIAAKLVKPDKTVVAVVGDGGFMMNSQELALAVQLKVHVTIIILNDSKYGMIAWKASGMGFPAYGMDLSNPDFVAYAQSYGANGYRIKSAGDFPSTLHHCINHPGVHVIELPIDYDVSSRLQVSALREHLEKTLEKPEAILSKPKTKAAASEAAGKPAPPPSKQGPSDAELAAAKSMPFYLASKAQTPNNKLLVTDKYTGKVAYKCAQASADDIDAAITAAVNAFPAMCRLSSFQRREILEHCVVQFKQRYDELAEALCVEAGKPIKDARGEVQRLIDTFVIAMEESTRIYGEWTPMDISARTVGMQAITRLFPIGVISMVSPFNFPLNLAAHKVAPALAVGCPFVLKPASRTPIGALIIGEVLANAPHLPPGAFSVLPCSRDGADLFTVDERFKLLSFTGSPGVGWAMKARAGKKKVVLELGGNAACMIEDYKSEAELKSVIMPKVMFGAYYQSGQSCISVQRLFVRQDLYPAVKEALIEAVSKLKKGDPHDPDTFIGPMIAESEAQRIEEWVDKAVAAGGKLLVGGTRDGVMYDATLLERVPVTCEVVAEEVFGPVLVLDTYATFKEAIDKTNSSKFGLQAGVFTHDIDKAWYAFEQLEVGGVVINQVPSIRVDSQAYGGVKDSGLGREGVRYAMKDMMEERVLMMSGIGGSERI